MPEYKIGLALVKSLGEKEKGLDERKNFIISQIKNFNDKSSHSLVNPKKIGLGEHGEDDIQISKTSLIITLYSQEELNTPGKAVRLLSQLLLTSDDPDNLSDLLSEKKLFKTFKVATTNAEGQSKSAIDIASFSDADLIKALVDYVCNSQDFSGRKRNAIDEIKRIAVENELLVPQNPNDISQEEKICLSRI